MAVCARCFPGGNSHYISATIAAIDTGDWSFAAWLKVTDPSQATSLLLIDPGQDILLYEPLSGPGWGIEGYQFSATSNDARSLTAFDAFTLNVWTFVVVQFTTSDNKIHIYHGDESTAVAEVSYVEQVALSGTRSTGGTAFELGRHNACVGRPSLWTKALSTAEMNALRTCTAPSQPNLHLYWPMSSATASSVQDSSGNGYHGTTNGTVTTAAAPCCMDIPPLRQRQRNDGLAMVAAPRQAGPKNSPSSRQHSIRQGLRNAYL